MGLRNEFELHLYFWDDIRNRRLDSPWNSKSLGESLRVCIAHFLELVLKVIEDSRLYIRFDIPCYDRYFVARCSRWKLKSCHPFHASRGRLLGSKLSMDDVKTPLVIVVRWEL